MSVLCIVAGWWIYDKMQPPTIDENAVRANIALGGAPILGNADASVTVVLFSDFECVYCGEFARDSFPTIKERYIDAGTARLAYMSFPLSQSHPYAAAAANAALCADEQGRFWEYHDVLYANQDALASDDLRVHAVAAGLDAQMFDDCMQDELFAAVIDRTVVYGKSLGVTGTPTFFFNGRKVVGALTPEDFAREIDAELATG
ncbi:MAG: hypothetical protein A2105_03100 [Omnitrophica WOR_2 bacterium GWF2_63_9]|nr:MAG: hypothetical protein A2105_03100 [Omnitrophica WOR_2 bacterium GWF2_63_9]